jgi:hypothetical protein
VHSKATQRKRRQCRKARTRADAKRKARTSRL